MKPPADRVGLTHVELYGGWLLWRRFVLRGSGFPASLLAPLAAPSLVEALDRLLADPANAHADANARLEDESARVARHLQQVAGDATFREACLWQNPQALRTAIDRVRDGADRRDRMLRRHGQLVAKY